MISHNQTLAAGSLRFEKKIARGLLATSLLLSLLAPARAADWALTGALGAHDPSIVKEGNTWWVFCTGSGLPIKHSPDGLNWSQGVQRFASELPWWRNYAPAMGPLDLWAPDVHGFGGRYWCYYCVSEFGTNNSAIGLTSCSSIAAGDWRDDGAVITSQSGVQAYNALDPDLVVDASGSPWLVFGSYFDGIHVVRLDPGTMKPTGAAYSVAMRANGIEGANIAYHNGYYYLFVSIDRCCLGVNSTYKIAYGRSINVTGPYVDREGTAMLSGGGSVLVDSGPRWKGPGGESVYASDGRWLIAFHAYDAFNNGDPTLMISDLFWDGANWPALSAPAITAPVFSTEPISVVVAGGTVALSAFASNAPTYQWMLSGTGALPGATAPILLLGDAVSAAGSYTCVATNSSGMAVSTPATVAVMATSDPGRLINLSCRATVETGANILIAGFAAGGRGTSGTKPLLLRASGPAIALAPFNVPGTLADPGVQLDRLNGDGTSTPIASNRGWGGNQLVSVTAASVGAFSWSNALGKDSALVENLPVGPYTALVSGVDGDSGIALAEVYDATPAGSFTASTPRLTNLSARVHVGTGGNILIAGFVIGGSSAKTVLVRASGPAIAANPFNVPGTLPDPVLTLRDLGTGAVLGTNGAWGGYSAISASAASVGAFVWNSLSSSDAAILVTLPPGAYTAEVAGGSGDTGISLVEVYEIP